MEQRTIDARHLLVFIYDQLLAHGAPPTSSEIAAHFDATPDLALRALNMLNVGKTVLLNPRTGEIWMAGPFSAVPTPYEVSADGVRWWANCAWDMLGIPVVADVPGVGANFQDHLKLSIRWNGKTELPGSTVTAGMFMRSDPAQYGDPPDLQFYIGRGLETPDKFITITASLVFPKSRGEIRLRSADPLAAPIIRANYLQEQADVNALVRGVHLARWFGEADSYADLRADEIAPGAAMQSDADLAAFARRDSDTIYHGAGTCKMGPASDEGSVVDASGRLHTSTNVYVADASIMPTIPRANTNLSTLALAERIAAGIGGSPAA